MNKLQWNANRISNILISRKCTLHLNISSVKWHLFCLGLDVLIKTGTIWNNDHFLVYKRMSVSLSQVEYTYVDDDPDMGVDAEFTHMLLHSHTVFLQSIINTLTHSPLEDVVIILKVQFLNTCFVKFLWTPQNTFYDESTLVWVMPWCHQTASHCLCQSWPRSMSPYVATKPPWVKAHTKWPPLFL